MWYNHIWSIKINISLYDLPGWLVLLSQCTSQAEAKCAPTGSSSDRSSLLTASLDLSLSFLMVCFQRMPAAKKTGWSYWKNSCIVRGLFNLRLLECHGVINKNLTKRKPSESLTMYRIYFISIYLLQSSKNTTDVFSIQVIVVVNDVFMKGGF